MTADELARARRRPVAGELKPRDFMALVKDAAFERLPFEPPKHRIHGSLLQMYYFEWPQNYEVSLGVHEHRTDRVRVHLSFAGESEENLRRLALVAEAMPDVMSSFGMNLDIYERRYSHGQVRAFVGFTVPRQPLDAAFAAEVGRHLARFIEVLEPVVGPLGALPWSTLDAREIAKRRARAAGGA